MENLLKIILAINVVIICIQIYKLHQSEREFKKKYEQFKIKENEWKRQINQS